MRLANSKSFQFNDRKFAKYKSRGQKADYINVQMSGNGIYPYPNQNRFFKRQILPLKANRGNLNQAYTS